MMNQNILEKTMNKSMNVNDAWRAGEAYFTAAKNEDYRRLSKEEIFSLLRSAMKIQNDNGLLPLYDDPEMPGDARVDMIYRPTYGITAVSIYAYLEWPADFDHELMEFMVRLLDGTYCRGIVGHGIESSETVRQTLEMLCRAGVRNFVEKYPEISPTFTKMVYRYMKQMRKISEKIDSDGYIVTENDFSAKSVNHKIKRLVALWEKKENPVFVYGTLLRGEPAHDFLKNGLFVGSYLLRNHAMYDLGPYPGIKPWKGETVFGELYYVNDFTLAELDHYEGNGILYQRTAVKVTSSSEEIDAEVYIYNGCVEGKRLLREAWKKDPEDLVWYAAYGSNLSSKRFACYIQGGICKENGKEYDGCTDKNTPLATDMKCYKGRLYFGNCSYSWNGCGVAFYDPNGEDHVYMKRYLITREQLHEVMYQEGSSPNWYGRLVCLEVDDYGIPVYTLTSETLRPENTPDPVYVDLIERSLVEYSVMDQEEARRYVENWM